MIKKGTLLFILIILAVIILTGCGSEASLLAVPDDQVVAAVADNSIQTNSESASTDEVVAVNNTVSPASGDNTQASVAEDLAENNPTHMDASDVVIDSAAVTTIELNGGTIAVEGEGVTVSTDQAVITAAGTYRLSGRLVDKQIVVDTVDEGMVQLILDGVDITNSSNAPIAIMEATEVAIILASDTENRVTDGSTYIFEDPESDEPNAAIYSTADLTIGGDGSLVVTGNYNDGITSKDGLVIRGGAITVNAVDDGIRGKDYLVVKDGQLVINAGGDGLVADNEEDAALGYIAIEGGVFTITAGGDAIQAQTDVAISGGQFTLTSGGGSTGQIAADDSAKGIKGAVSVAIDGGTFVIDAADDAIHSNSDLVINDGTFEMASGDDAIHADLTLTINSGDIRITQSYEGIESALITLNGGDIEVVASDDGINVAGGTDGSGMMAGPGRNGRPARGGAPNQDTFTYTGDSYLYLNGGTITVDAGGDGIDVNGAIEMTAGLVLVNGPTEQMNAALDYDAAFNISGGYLVMAGSAGMAQAPSGSSTQNSVLINLGGTLPGRTLVNIQDASGQSLLTFAPSKASQSILFSSPDLVSGDYTLYYGGDASGTTEAGLYTDSVYTPGTAYTTFTVSGVTTIIGGGAFR